MIPYIGDISKQDAEVLRELAESHFRILEFGVGASTQILSKYTQGSVVSIDTSDEWIKKTINNLQLLEINSCTVFGSYKEFMEESDNDNLLSDISKLLNIKAGYDLIFDDGSDEFRKDFALKIWKRLEVGGILAFHDTRRWQDARNVCHVLEQIHESVDRVIWNYNHSNITLVYKKEHEPYENWQETENRMPWQIGWGDPDVEYVKKQLHG